MLIAEELSPATIEALGPDFEVRHVDGADRAALLPAVADVDALLVRSATKVDAEVLAAARSLKVVARAGVGLDNVDVKAATQAGVMVVNAPQSNIVSAAELAVGLLLAAARHIAAGATRALKQGEWKRSKYTGVELYEKTAGIVGLGRIGALVAQRLSRVRHERHRLRPVRRGRPGRPDGCAAGLARRAAARPPTSSRCTCPRRPETVGLIGDEQLATVKPSLILVNAARGGIVDEDALYAALKEGRVAAAGLDVFATEPCTDSPLFELENVVATPHLGASTDEAQEKAGVVGRPVGAARAGRRAGARRGQRAGRRHRRGRPAGHPAGRAPRPVLHRGRWPPCPRSSTSRCAARSPRTTCGCSSWPRSRACSSTSSRTRSPTSTRRCSPPSAASQVRLTTDAESPDYRNLVTLRGTLADGTQVSVSGTLTGTRHVEKVVEIDGFDVEVALSEHMAVFRYEDRPGIVGTVGPDARRGRGQHRRHAGQPRPPRRARAGRDDGRLRDPGRRARRHRPRDRRRDRPPGRPHRLSRAVPASGTALTTGETRCEHRPTVRA